MIAAPAMVLAINGTSVPWRIVILKEFRLAVTQLLSTSFGFSNPRS
jgi:hypothetical protein